MVNWEFRVATTNQIERRVYRETINNYHSYKKWTDVPGRRIGWNIYVDGELVGVIGLASSSLALGARDKFIGWTKEQRMKHLQQIANNYRFCMIKTGLGSQVLGRWVPIARQAWFKKYKEPLFLIETMVEPPHTGVVYTAASWLRIGTTSGVTFTRYGPALLKGGLLEGGKHKERIEKAMADGTYTKQYRLASPSSVKIVFVKPIVKNFKEKLMA